MYVKGSIHITYDNNNQLCVDAIVFPSRERTERQRRIQAYARESSF